MYLPDGDPYRYMLTEEMPGVICVGWLDSGHPYPTGEPAVWVMGGLVAIATSSAVNQTRGHHGCPFCGGYDDPTISRPGERRLVLGSAEIWIQGADGRVFASPDMIIHYMSDHHYRPPADYIAALRWFLDCKPAFDGDALRHAWVHRV